VVLKALLLLLAFGKLAVADKALDKAALSAVFPGTQISGTGRNYIVAGPAKNVIERCASRDLTTEQFSDRRIVELHLFDWPGEKNSGLLAVLQYKFENANPAGSCWSIGLLTHLVKEGSGWRLKDRYLLENMHHASSPKIRLIDLKGSGLKNLVVESAAGWAGGGGTNLHIFDLHRESFDELLHVYSFIVDQDQDGYSQKLDVLRTRQSRGAQFCFAKKQRFESGVMFTKPKTSTPCYQPSEGVDPVDNAERAELLKPLQP
jgi:hypothetical protein